MSCTNQSRVLSVLLGNQREIRAFLASSEQSDLSNAVWWLHHSTPSCKLSLLWPTDEELTRLAQRLHTRLAGKFGRYSVRKNRTKLKLRLAQVRVLLRDLLLVAYGLRPSCLVDCCTLSKELAGLLLEAFADANDGFYQYGKATQLRAILLDRNVFFVNVDAFIREKMTTELQCEIIVDASASLTQPRRLRSTSPVDALRMEALTTWTSSACKRLLSSTSLVLEWTRPSTLNATALAGLLLCYPCLYDMKGSHDEIDNEWSKQENCLAMCPLYVVQIAVLVPQQAHHQIVLYEFSVPQHLINDRYDEEQGQERDQNSHFSPLLNVLRARCLIKLQRAIKQSSFASIIQAHVLVNTCTLLHVAL